MATLVVLPNPVFNALILCLSYVDTTISIKKGIHTDDVGWQFFNGCNLETKPAQPTRFLWHISNPSKQCIRKGSLSHVRQV